MIQGLASIHKINHIIEAASGLIKFVNLAIAADVGDPLHNADWLVRYPYIKDLHIVTATESDADSDHLSASMAYTDAYPALGFYVDEIRPNPAMTADGHDEHFFGSLGARVEVVGETFAIAQREMHEIQGCIRSILNLDRSLGNIQGRGGVIDVLKFSHFAEPIFLPTEERETMMALTYFYKVFFKEVVIR